MANIQININRSDVSQSDINQLQNFFNGLPDSKQKILAENYSSFSSWLKEKSPRLYNNIYPILSNVWNQIQDLLEDILEGVAIGAAVVVAAPIVGVYEGLKALGKWLDD